MTADVFLNRLDGSPGACIVHVTECSVQEVEAATKTNRVYDSSYVLRLHDDEWSE